MTRIFVLSGWFGRMFSPGMYALAGRLKPFGDVSFHDWDDTQVIPMIVREPSKIAVIGFSLGANQLSWISDHVHHSISLGVAYDPSRQSPLVVKVQDAYIQRAPQFDRLLCYHNTGTWFYGGARYVGQNVETHEINLAHLQVQFAEGLHQITIAAVEKLNAVAE